jgi:hypothetical protein
MEWRLPSGPTQGKKKVNMHRNLPSLGNLISLPSRSTFECRPLQEVPFSRCGAKKARASNVRARNLRNRRRLAGCAVSLNQLRVIRLIPVPGAVLRQQSLLMPPTMLSASMPISMAITILRSLRHQCKMRQSQSLTGHPCLHQRANLSTPRVLSPRLYRRGLLWRVGFQLLPERTWQGCECQNILKHMHMGAQAPVLRCAFHCMTYCSNVARDRQHSAHDWSNCQQ